MNTTDSAGSQWRKSSRSGNSPNCVEVAHGELAVGVRDSKNPAPTLAFSSAAWQKFLVGLAR